MRNGVGGGFARRPLEPRHLLQICSGRRPGAAGVDSPEEAAMIRATLVCAALVCGAFASVRAQEPSRADGWVVIAIDEYRALRLKAYPPDRPPDPPPVDATITRVEYDLRAGDQLVAGEVRLTVDVLKEGWIRVEVPSGLLVRASRLDGRPVSIIDLSPDRNGGPAHHAPHVLLSRRGR